MSESVAQPTSGTPANVAALPPRGRSLKQAVATAVLLLGLMAAFYALGRDWFFGLIVVVVSIALFELLDALVQTGHGPNIIFGVACGIAMMTVAFLQKPAWFAVVLLATAAGSFLVAMRPRRGRTPMTDAAWTVLGVAWVGGGGAGATLILMFHDNGLRLLIAFVLVAAVDDIAAYFAGTYLGKHKLAPAISPGKSWEGAVGGFVVALGGGILFGWWLGHLTVAQGLGIGVICGLLVPLGDLVESLAKREIGIKDSGRLLPGHGGFLDRLDAIIMCAPAVYLYLRIVGG
ncbi:MAG: phosphatidate cytidylyltransferase [Actinomycetota bacterium]|nr:phosphatidate cytidylyltransferase [Actinomycetota bacterium]